ncbi:thiamine pyrophosphate-binding protein [Streptomyces flaveolus]|uniref:Thiamine pyrophosphate-binding protein n=1 Tax=Streptomyces flaveolus TaxID=67297 RepID=A0ABV1VEF6_9ACTN
MTSPTVAHRLLDLLSGMGVTRLFGVPGGPLLPLLNTLHEHPGLRFVLTKHEEGAVFMAEGHAQTTGELGVACVTAGPGTTHALTAAASATSDWAPVLVLAGQVPTTAFGRGGLQDSSGGNWSIDTVHAFTSATKLAALVSDPGQLPSLFARAVRTATDAPQGAVLLVLPGNVLATHDQGARAPLQGLTVPNPRSSTSEPLNRIAEALTKAHRPVILAGQGAKVGRAKNALVALAEKRQCKVATTIKGKSVFPERHPLSLGVFGTYGASQAAHSVVTAAETDLLLVVGSSLGEVSTAGWDPALADGRVMCQIDIDPLQIGRNYQVDHPLVADAATALRALVDLLPDGEGDLRPSAVRRPTASQLQSDHRLLRASAVAAHLSAALPEDVLLFLDNGNTLCWMGEHYLCPSDAEVYCSLNVGCMGYAVPASIGAKLARPDRPVVAVLGDAAFAMGGMELHTAAELGLPIVWIVLNNSGNAMVANLQHLLFNQTNGSLYTHPLDAAAVARCLGVRSASVSSLTEFSAALECALQSGAPFLIDARVDGGETPWSLRARADTLKSAE